jgi:hypothetical protein
LDDFACVISSHILLHDISCILVGLALIIVIKGGCASLFGKLHLPGVLLCYVGCLLDGSATHIVNLLIRYFVIIVIFKQLQGFRLE